MNWTLTIEVDETTGEHYIQFPEDALEGLGWQPGDTITWLDNNNGSWTLTKQHDKTSSI
jgi:hypothetical protein